MIVETERLNVRNLKLTDKHSLFDIYSDKEAMKYRASKPFETFEEVDRMLEIAFYTIKTKVEFRYAVDLKTNNELIGTFVIKPMSESQCEIGYSIGKKYWGSGYGKELVEGMIACIKKLSYQKIIAISKKENGASIKLLENFGFQLIPEKESNNCCFFEYNVEK